MRIAGVVVLIAGAVAAAIMWLFPVRTVLVGHQFMCPGPPIDVLFTTPTPTGNSLSERDYITGCQTAKTQRMTIGSTVVIPIVAAGCALLVAGRRTRGRI